MNKLASGAVLGCILLMGAAWVWDPGAGILTTLLLFPLIVVIGRTFPPAPSAPPPPARPRQGPGCARARRPIGG